MYIHLGQNTVVRTSRIIGIFDTDSSTQNNITKQFLKKAQSEGRLYAVSDDIPKSFVVTDDNRVYMCQLSAAALKGRI